MQKQDCFAESCCYNLLCQCLYFKNRFGDVHVQETPGMDNSTITKWILEYKALLIEGDKEGM